MSKKKTNNDQQPTFVGELLENGTAIIKAASLAEIAELVNEIPADCKYSVGAAGRLIDDGSYTLRVDLIKD